MPIRTTFSRPSASWQGEPPMPRIAGGVPRYEPGLFGNQLTAAQARLAGGWTLKDPASKGTLTFDPVNGGLTVSVTAPAGLLAGELLLAEAYFRPTTLVSKSVTFSATVRLTGGSYGTDRVQFQLITDDGTGYAFTATTVTTDGRKSVTRTVPAAPRAVTVAQLRVSSATTIPQGFSVQFTLAQVEVGSSVSAWQPGPPPRALAISEGTVNLLGNLQSTFNGTVGGWSALNSGVVTPDSTLPREGNGSLKVVCANVASSGAQSGPVTTGVPASGTFTYSAYYRGDPSQGLVATSMTLEIVATYTTGSPGSATVNVTPDPNGYKRAAVTLVSDNARTLSSLTLRARSNGTQNGLISYWDAVQLEQKASPTIWTRGGVDRDPTVVTVAGRDTFTPAAWTIEGWYLLEQLTTADACLIDTRNPGTNFSYIDALILFQSGTGLVVQYGTGSSFVTASGGSAPRGVWHYVAVRGNATTVSVWLDGAQAVTSATAPVLSVPPSILLGGFGLSRAPALALNGLLGGLRFSRVYRSDAECLAQATNLDPFVADGATTALFDFDGRLREPLPDFNAQFVAEADFVTPASVTASPAALANYLETNVTQYDFPTQTWRSTDWAPQTLTFDLGNVKALAGLWIFAANYEGLTVTTSLDGTSYSDYPGSPYAVLLDMADGYRKCLVRGRVQAQFVQLTVLGQIPADGSPYLESGSIIFFSDLNALPRQFTDYTVSTERHYLSDESGGHLDTREAGPQFVNVTFGGRWEMALIREARQMGLFGQGKPFLFFLNIGNPEEVYLLQMTRSVTYKLSGITYEGQLECRSRA